MATVLPPFLRPIIYLTWIPVVILALSSTPARGDAITPTFVRAQDAFVRKDYGRSIQILQVILKKAPDHMPSLILLGQAYIRTGQPQPAAAIFKRVPVTNLPENAALDYGVAMYMTKHYSRAIQGLSKVNATDPNRDLARFYGAVSYMQLRQWARAANLLRAIRKLPPKLTAERRRLLRDLERFERAEQSNQFNRMGSPNFGTIPPPAADFESYQPSVQTAPGAKDKPKPVAPAPAPSGLTADITPGLSYAQTAGRQEFGGYKSTNSNEIKKTVSSALNLKYQGEPWGNGGIPYASFKFYSAYVDDDASNITTSFIAYADDPNAVLAAETSTPLTNTFWLDVKATPELSLPVTSKVDLLGGYEYSAQLDETKLAKMTARRGPYATLDLELTPLSTQFTVSSTDAVDVEGKVYKNTLEESANLNLTIESYAAKGFLQNRDVSYAEGQKKSKARSSQRADGTLTKTWDGLSASATVGYIQLTPFPGVPLVGSALSTSRFELSSTASTNPNVGLSLTLTGGYLRMDGFSQSVTATNADGSEGAAATAQVSADQMFAKSNLKFVPLSWFSFTFGLDYATTTYGIKTPEYSASFKKQSPSSSTNTNFGLEITKTF